MSTGTAEQVDEVEETPHHRSVVPFVVAVAVLLALVAGFGVGRLLPGSSTPGDTSAAAGFSRDMQVHHAQAVQMSMVVVHEGVSADVRQIADDITVTQEQQIGQMFAWLQLWGLSQTGSQPAMAWMAASGRMHDMTGPSTPAATTTGGAGGTGTSAMPGMASAADLARLARLRGRAAEVLYLQLMVAHHRGGVSMAQAVLDLPAPDEVHHLAQTIVTSQTSEIQAMQQLLAARGATA